MSQTKAQLVDAVDGSIVDADIVGLSSSKLSGTLPAVSAANLTNIPAANLTGTLPAISGANLTGISAGITMADQWRLTTDLSGTSPNDFITSNLERVDTSGQGTIGTAMSESSGVFTFPSTGIYKVDFQVNVYSSSSQRYVGGRINATTDNSNYTILTDSSDGIYVPSTSSWGTCETSTLIDVTDTSNVKVKFGYYGIGSITFKGSSTQNRTFMTFIRLGDT